MIREIIRNDITSDICRLGLELNMHHKFCSYTTSAENQSANIKLSLPANKKIIIFWGDGTSTVVTGAVTTTTYSHTYTDVKTYNLTVSGDYNDITYLNLVDTFNINISELPQNIIKYVGKWPTITNGTLQELNLLPMLQYFQALGDISGDIKDTPVIDFLVIKTINTGSIYGNIQDIKISLYLALQKSTITGSSFAPDTTLQYIQIYDGENTVSFDLADTPINIRRLIIKGNNTISNYSGRTWINNFDHFDIEPVAPGGLSSAEIDQLLIDLDEDLDWSDGGVIKLLGTNAPRTSASDDAVNNIVAEGGTVITNN